MRSDLDVLIVGAGLGGTALALRLAASGIHVGLVAKKPLEECSSSWAQGGISAALGPEDSPAAHASDTIRAGRGLCNPDTVDLVVSQARDCIQWLLDQGVTFTGMENEETDLHLTQEGGHSARRVVHAEDATGRAVMSGLRNPLLNNDHIHLFQNHLVIDLITTAKLGLSGENRCVGVYALNLDTGHVETLGARAVVLATGGASKIYLYTSNPDTATGDGIAMAWRAGCRVANLEFVQFHPTCLYHPQAKTYLISEALRGEGAMLRLPDGTRFMPEHHEDAELAPRDVVARTMDYEMKRGGFDCLYLDISHRPAPEILKLFPNIAGTCSQYGIDITREPIPVVPAAHYSCGGVMTDLNARTDVPGLYAVGECTHTGLHGANRLASNSLLECLVFAKRAHDSISEDLPLLASETSALPQWDESRVVDADEQIVVSHNWDELRRFMWDYVGIVRTNKRLERARHRIELLQDEIFDYYGNFRIGNDLIELRNLALVASLTIASAQARGESRGLHYNRDFPETLPDDQARDTILQPDT